MNFQSAYEPRFSERPPGGGRPEHKKIIRQLPDVLDVVAVISNPVRYRSRYDLYRQFERTALEAGARLTTVEMAYGGRLFEVTEPGNPRHLQVRSSHELWHKENLINLGIKHLPRDWRYVAWVDADLLFARHDWVQETLQQLQHYPVVQMWSHAQDLGPNHEPLANYHESFAYCYLNQVDWSLAPNGGAYQKPPSPGKANYWHPGFAWAARREAIDALGGLIDFAILGAGDMHMAKALVGRVGEGTYPGISPAYLARLTQWQDRAEAYIRRDLGYVPGTILHYFHGKKADRRYWNRWQILVQNQYDPDLDLKYDWQGLLQLTDRSIGLRDGIRRYFRQRNEDGTEAV